MCSMRTLGQLQRQSIQNQYVITCKSRRILHCILRIITLNCSWPIGEIRLVVLASVDYRKYVGFVSCCTIKVKLLLVLTSQNAFDALHHVTCVIFSRILLSNVLLVSVDDVCIRSIIILHGFSFIIIYLLALIRCPNLEKYSPCSVPRWDSCLCKLSLYIVHIFVQIGRASCRERV